MEEDEDGDLNLWASTSEEDGGSERQGGQRTTRKGKVSVGMTGATIAGQTQVWECI